MLRSTPVYHWAPLVCHNHLPSIFPILLFTNPGRHPLPLLLFITFFPRPRHFHHLLFYFILFYLIPSYQLLLYPFFTPSPQYSPTPSLAFLALFSANFLPYQADQVLESLHHFKLPGPTTRAIPYELKPISKPAQPLWHHLLGCISPK